MRLQLSRLWVLCGELIAQVHKLKCCGFVLSKRLTVEAWMITHVKHKSPVLDVNSLFVLYI